MEKEKLVMFDFDGVLIDTFLMLHGISSEVNENLLIDEYKNFFKGNIYSAIRNDGTPRKSNPNLSNLYDIGSRELVVPDSLKNVIKNISSNFILTIVSSTPTSSIDKVLEREDLQSYFIDILGRDVHTSKVIKIKMLLEKYSVLPENTVFVTDTVGDIKEARECGVKSIAVTWGFHNEETLKEAKPVKIVSTPESLQEAIKDVLK